MMSKSQELLNILHAKFGEKEYVSIGSHTVDNYDVIAIEPADKKQLNSCAKVILEIYPEHEIGVKIGKGNYFDLPDSDTKESLDFLLEIVDTVVQGKIKETVKTKNTRILRSTIVIDLPQGTTKFNYKNGLLALGAKQHVIKYDSYQGYS